jgi:hypothetical protein
VGIWHGRTYNSPGFSYTILEELWKIHWRRCSRLPDYSLVPKRIHGRGREVPDQSPSSAILPTLGRARPLFFHHNGRSHTASPGGALVFVTVPPTIQYAAQFVVDQRAIFRDDGRHIVDCGVGGDVYSGGAACCSILVDWVARRNLRLNSYEYFTDTAHLFALTVLLSMLFYAHVLFITYAILGHGCVTGGSDGATDVES